MNLSLEITFIQSLVDSFFPFGVEASVFDIYWEFSGILRFIILKCQATTEMPND